MAAIAKMNQEEPMHGMVDTFVNMILVARDLNGAPGDTLDQEYTRGQVEMIMDITHIPDLHKEMLTDLCQGRDPFSVIYHLMKVLR